MADPIVNAYRTAYMRALIRTRRLLVVYAASMLMTVLSTTWSALMEQWSLFSVLLVVTLVMSVGTGVISADLRDMQDRLDWIESR